MIIVASRVREMNDKIDLMLLMRPDALNPRDGLFFPVRPSFEPRPANDDEFETQMSEDGKLGITRKRDGPMRTPEADLIHAETNSSLCNACLSALGHLAKHMEQKITIPDFSLKSDRLPPSVVLHWNLMALMSSRMNGCHLCSIISAHLHPRYLEYLKIMRDCRVELVVSTNLEDISIDEPEDTRISACITPNSVPEITNQNYWQVCKMRLWPSPHNDRIFPIREPMRDNPSPDGLEVPTRGPSTRFAKAMAKQWLERCKSNHDGVHEACVAKGSWLPTRLIDLSNAEPGGKVKIVSTAEHPELFADNPPYITLSHCWGDWRESGLPRLLMENMARYMLEGLPFHELPPLIQDATEIAQWFNVRWLWIDSLCIIQDSPGMADWTHEALLMCKVYKYGLLNISADASDDARGGCFRQRSVASVTPFKLEMANLEKSWWMAMDERDVFEWVLDAPLSRRAWVFQERQLARRALHFTKHEVFWECCAPEPYCACETYAAGSPFDTRFLNVSKYEPSRLSMGDDLKVRLRDWMDLCEDFSEKALTFQTDRLPALAGLAMEYAHLFPGDSYVAGFWSSSLPTALLWSGRGSIKENNGQDIYAVPSWSWLSLGSAVSFRSLPKTEPKFIQPIAQVRATHITPLTPSPFGQIQQGACLELEGFLRRIRIVKRPVTSDIDEADEWYMPNQTFEQMIFLDGSDRAHEDPSVGSPHGDSLHYTLDNRQDNEDVEEDEHIQDDAAGQTTDWSGFCFLVAISRFSDDLKVEGLLLNSIDSESTFTRAGTIKFSGEMALSVVFEVEDTVTDDEIMKAARSIPDPIHGDEGSNSEITRITEDINDLQVGDGSRPEKDSEDWESRSRDNGDPFSVYEVFKAPVDTSFAKLSCSKIKII